MKVRQNHKRIMRMIARHNGFYWSTLKLMRKIDAILEKKYPCSLNTASLTTKAR